MNYKEEILQALRDKGVPCEFDVETEFDPEGNVATITLVKVR